MSFISFGITTKELLSGTKTVTRRVWTEKRRNEWVNNWNNSRLIHDAYDKSPRNGGIIIGKIELTTRPYLEELKDMPKHEFIAEGGMVDNVKDFCKLINRKPSDIVSVIRFKFIPLVALECSEKCKFESVMFDGCGVYNVNLKYRKVFYRCEQCIKDKYLENNA